jgi:hypothetical protein
VKQIQGVCGVVHENYAIFRVKNYAKQRAGTRRIAIIGYQLAGNLRSP